MIQINLLPEEFKKKESQLSKIDVSALQLDKLPIVNILIGLGVVLVIVQALLFFVGIHSESNLKTLTRELDKLLPEQKVSSRLKIEADQMSKKVGAIDELMVKRFRWAEKLNELSDCMVSGIWLTDLTYDEKAGLAMQQSAQPKDKKAPQKTPEKAVVRYLTISGYASGMGEEGTATIGKFIKNLKMSEGFYSDFQDIELGTIKRDKVLDQEIMSFTITCAFKE